MWVSVPQAAANKRLTTKNQRNISFPWLGASIIVVFLVFVMYDHYNEVEAICQVENDGQDAFSIKLENAKSMTLKLRPLTMTFPAFKSS